jgi:hypothetical protein
VTETAYPPEPWYLGGSMLVSVFAVPAETLPPEFALPQGRRALRIGSCVIVGVAAVQYLPGGVLEYDELLVAVPSLGRGGLRVTIPQIWVDSPASRLGGRELWGIPKQLARFTRRAGPGGRTRFAMHTVPVARADSATGSGNGTRNRNGSTSGHGHGNHGNKPTAALQARRGLPLVPGMRQLALPILQQLDGRVILSHNRVVGRMSGLRASWRFAADGPLGHLAGRRPLLSVALHDAAIIFGMDVVRSPAAASAAAAAAAEPAHAPETSTP